MGIYERSIAVLQRGGLIAESDRILVACGGDTDARALRRVGLSNALITNVDDRRSDGIGAYEWSHADAEDLPFPSGSFDWGIVHAGLHHCASPHRGLLELLRVSQKGVLVVEARDGLLMRLAILLGLTPDYEIECVALDEQGGGGVRNSGIPNFIYRWTEREVRKTVESAYPDTVNEIRFFYGLALPVERMTMSRPIKRAVVTVASLAAKLAFKAFPRCGNQFAFAVIKTGRDKPWITRGETAKLDPDYRLGFDPSRYAREEVDEAA